MKPARRQPVRIDKEQWSEKSRGGLDYVFASEFYEDKPFTCIACGQKAVFTAEQQKYTYEVKKAFTWEQHVLCATCFQQHNELLAEAAVFSASWESDKASLKGDRAALQRWKVVLELLPTYGIRKDAARIRMLTKLLQNVA